ncbi:hypothetical protein ACFS5L_02215 [Streptomyces phyllanthi]|uniref:Uncharacterized protein n=1 Tax=Streptomyces phyllanthi TaxID=1803180 RepID=A0A5N8WAJ7_9ACTN|nr:hypothetical protein [Streptomyces phyllanthi]MPY44497.1 hypothetical protein [Streptomyces phyllanthi]
MPISPYNPMTPDDVRAAGETLKKLAEQLDTASSPQEAARLINPVVAPEEGILPILSLVLAAASRTASRNARPSDFDRDVWHSLG